MFRIPDDINIYWIYLRKIQFYRYAPPHPYGIWPLTANILDPVLIFIYSMQDDVGKLCSCPVQFVFKINADMIRLQFNYFNVVCHDYRFVLP